MGGIISWIKNHKLVCLLFIIIFYLLAKDSFLVSRSPRLYQTEPMIYNSAKSSSPIVGGGEAGMVRDAAPSANVKDRMVIKDSYLSLQVLKVVDIQKKIIQKAIDMGGYMVNSSISNPNDIASATVIVRIPAKQLDSTLEYYRSLAIKVVSENLQGTDVTDQYTDLDAQLLTYEKTKNKFVEMLDRATIIQDILQIQREIINIQSSIDSIKGQQDYFKKNAAMAKITVYLASDELNLPYAPNNAWRPSVIFKQAVRSLIAIFYIIATFMIWIGVFAIIWVPALLIYFYFKRRSK